MPDLITATVYEHPLNERLRFFLRLEFLFKQADYSLNGTSTWNSRAALQTIIEIHDLVSRVDLKTEILKELDRHRSRLADAWRDLEVLSRLKERQAKVWQTEQAKREREAMDEIGQVRAMRPRGVKGAR